MSGDRHLHAEGPDKEIFLRALREYSEGCEPPHLTVGCPFRRAERGGVPWCLDECVDLLATHNAPPALEVTVGSFGLARSRRPRPRRWLGSPPSAFDARQVFLADQHLPLVNRRTVALLYELNLILTSPGSADKSKMENAETILAGRGFDVEMLIKEGMSQDIATAILGSVFVLDVLKQRSVTSIPPDFTMFEAWTPLLQRQRGPVEVIDNEDETFDVKGMGALFRYRPAVENWVRSASLDDVVQRNPPAALNLHETSPSRTEHGWLCDRFLKTYLTDWDTESLKLEWTYLHGGGMPPCTASEMNGRKVDEVELAKVLAHRVALAQPARTSLGSFTPRAVDLLRKGEREGAAAIFEAVVAAEPDHAEAQNNLGFCLLPDNPQRALYALRNAAELGFERTPHNVGNRVLALAMLGRLTPALELAERFAEIADAMPATFGWMWEADLSGKKPVLQEFTDVRAYVMDLAVIVAKTSGDKKLIEEWEARRASFDEGCTTS